MRSHEAGMAHPAAGLPVAAWTIGVIQAHRNVRLERDTEEAKATFLAMVDQSSIGLKAVMTGTPYA